jgi:hypothetical protein
VLGPDIGCGIAAHPLTPGTVAKLQKRRRLETCEAAIAAAVPCGAALHVPPAAAAPESDESLAAFLTPAFDDANAVLPVLLLPLPPELREPHTRFTLERLQDLCTRVGASLRNDVICALGTLGSGNHFIEVGMLQQETETRETRDRTDGTELPPGFAFAHSGSRRLGLAVFHHHAAIAERSADHVLRGADAVSYAVDVVLLTALAKINRALILRAALAVLPDAEFTLSRIIDCAHNTMDWQGQGQGQAGKANIVRKGAAPARAGELVLVALNSRDGVLLCAGTGADEWNASTAHGCGRAIPRAHAARKIQLRAYEQAMVGVVSSSVRVETLDEAPQAYKSAEDVRRALDGSIVVLGRYAAALNIKGW